MKALPWKPGSAKSTKNMRHFHQYHQHQKQNSDLGPVWLPLLFVVRFHCFTLRETMGGRNFENRTAKGTAQKNVCNQTGTFVKISNFQNRSSQTHTQLSPEKPGFRTSPEQGKSSFAQSRSVAKHLLLWPFHAVSSQIVVSLNDRKIFSRKRKLVLALQPFTEHSGSQDHQGISPADFIGASALVLELQAGLLVPRGLK